VLDAVNGKWGRATMRLATVPVDPTGGMLREMMSLRAAVIVAFVSVPVSNVAACLFGMAMGFLWLSTVPLTNGVVASVIGVRNGNNVIGLGRRIQLSDTPFETLAWLQFV